MAELRTGLMIEQALAFLQEAAPVLVSLTFAGSVIAISIWFDSDDYRQRH